MRLRILLLVTLVLALGTTRRAAAQGDPWKNAQSAFNQGETYYLSGKFDDAAASFKKAYEARPMPQFLYNVGAAYHMKGKKASEPESYDKAVDYYTRYLGENKDAKDKEQVEKVIAVLKAEAERLRAAAAAAAAAAATQPTNPTGPQPTPTPPPAPSAEVEALGDAGYRGLVVIESEPQGANIYIGGKEKGPFAQTPWSGSMDGEFQYLVEKRGYKSKEGRTSADPSKLLVLQIVLSEEDYLGWIEIKSNIPGALVYSDDKASGPIGKTPFSGNFKPGKHKIWIAADGYDEYSEDIEIVAGKTHEIAANLRGAPVGYLNIRGANLERARVMVDGAVVCEKGPCRTPVREGKRTIVVSRSGFKPYRARLELQAKTELTVTPALVKRPGRADAVVAYIFTGLLAGGATGAYFYAKGLKMDDSMYDKRDYIKYGAYAGWGLAGVVGLSAIYYTFRDKGPPSTGTVDVKALALTPALGSDFAGLSVGGGF